jgi:hypothetical protein
MINDCFIITTATSLYTCKIKQLNKIYNTNNSCDGDDDKTISYHHHHNIINISK